ncbi:U3 small nucleolar ribonucleoprotein IMP3 [Astathelohania contejeani]|uniref:U3 small nucleolar ribonucleoprotein IMP3 n=1 Tax=Astathelohania contejeani TaxID=164912 RepID=A0ABQ7I1F8_9MICR|nr:U3 small nucleolar ribonucleoprotein IMP3 [Thelohania contejeani]
MIYLVKPIEMRQLKYHEERLLRKVNFLNWKSTNTTREHQICAKYYLHNREDYHTYNKLVGKIKKLTECLARLKDTEETKNRLGKGLIRKLYSIGIINDKKLIECTQISVSSICKRRLPSIMVDKKMVDNLGVAVRLVQQGHVKIGSRVVNDTSVLVSRGMEDFVTWADSSKIRKTIKEFEGMYDDYDYV